MPNKHQITNTYDDTGHKASNCLTKIKQPKTLHLNNIAIEIILKNTLPWQPIINLATDHHHVIDATAARMIFGIKNEYLF